MLSFVQSLKDIPLPKQDFSFYYNETCEVVNASQKTGLAPKLPKYRLVFMFNEDRYEYDHKVEEFDKEVFLNEIKTKDLVYSGLLDYYSQNESCSVTEIANTLNITVNRTYYLLRSIWKLLTNDEYWNQIYISTSYLDLYRQDKQGEQLCHS